jgi:hypothetical protein
MVGQLIKNLYMFHAVRGIITVFTAARSGPILSQMNPAHFFTYPLFYSLALF